MAEPSASNIFGNHDLVDTLIIAIVAKLAVNLPDLENAASFSVHRNPRVHGDNPASWLSATRFHLLSGLYRAFLQRRLCEAMRDAPQRSAKTYPVGRICRVFPISPGEIC